MGKIKSPCTYCRRKTLQTRVVVRRRAYKFFRTRLLSGTRAVSTVLQLYTAQIMHQKLARHTVQHVLKHHTQHAQHVHVQVSESLKLMQNVVIPSCV